MDKSHPSAGEPDTPEPGTPPAEGGRAFSDNYPWFADEEVAVEAQAKFEACEIMVVIGRQLGLEQIVAASAATFLHVFAVGRSVVELGEAVTAVSVMSYATGLSVCEVLGGYWSFYGPPATREGRMAFIDRLDACRAQVGACLGTDAEASLPITFLGRVVDDVYGDSPLVPSMRGDISVKDVRRSSQVALQDVLMTTACTQYHPRTLAAAAFWLAHRCLRVGEPLVQGADGRFVPWHEHWHFNMDDVRAVATETATRTRDPRVTAALEHRVPPPRRVSHTRPRAQLSPPARGALPCPRCQVLFTQPEYVAHRDACKASYVRCVPCGGVHRDRADEHAQSCCLECATCGRDVAVGDFDEHRVSCAAATAAAAADAAAAAAAAAASAGADAAPSTPAKRAHQASEMRTPPSGPGQKRFVRELADSVERPSKRARGSPAEVGSGEDRPDTMM